MFLTFECPVRGCTDRAAVRVPPSISPAASRTVSRVAPRPVRWAGTGPTGHNGAVSSSTPHHTSEHPESAAGTGDPSQPLPQITEKQARRLNAPVQGMLISMAVLLLLVLPFVWLQPRPDAQPYRPDVDVAQEASYVADDSPFPPAVPEPGEDWSANYARWNPGAAQGVPFWEIGWASPQGSFIGLVQTSLANPTWLAQQTETIPATATVEAGGVPWDVHVREASRNQKALTVYTGEVNGSTVVLKGDAPAAELDDLASAVAEDLADRPAPGPQEQP